MKKMVALLLILTTLSGCSTHSSSPPPYAPPESRQLTVYTSHKEAVYLPLIREFEERTGIWVNVVTGGTNELLARIRREQDLPTADVMFGGGVESLDSHRDCFEPYETAGSDAIIHSFTSPSRWWTPFSALPVVLIYNTKLVSPSDLTGWEDLTKPQFCGKIAFADPKVSGSSFTALVTELYALEPTRKQPMASLAQALDGKLLPDSGDVIAQVAEGKYAVGITLEQSACKAIDEGKDIGIVYPHEGTSCVPDGSALIARGPHPENARAFLDFIVSEDAQNLLARQIGRRPVRKGVSLPPGLPPTEELVLVPYNVEWACKNQSSILQQWAALTEEQP